MLPLLNDMLEFRLVQEERELLMGFMLQRVALPMMVVRRSALRAEPREDTAPTFR